MKKVIAFTICFILVFCAMGIFTACAEAETYDVVCTVFPQYDFCRNIAGEEISVKLLLPFGTDAHNYALTTKDKAVIKSCKLFVYIGGESEAWVNDVIRSTDLEGVKLLKLSEKINLIATDGHDATEHGAFDEHIWLSVKNALTITDALSSELVALFPDRKDSIMQNTQKYISELSDLDTEYREKLSRLRDKRLYFADRFPFAYMCKEYGLNYVSLFGGCSTDAMLSSADKIEFERAYAESGANGVFVLEHSDTKLARSITGEYGGGIYVLDSCQTVTKKDFDGGTNYLGIMRANLAVIEEGLR